VGLAEQGRVELLLNLDPRRVAVLLVDLQRAFCGGTAQNAATALRANAFAADAARFGVRVIYSRQVLELDRLTHRQRRWEEASTLCVPGSAGAELVIPPVPGARVVRKDRFDIWRSREFLELLAEWNVDGLVIGGVELQCCVLYAVLGADERGFHYVVPQDLVSGVDRCVRTNRAVRDYLSFVHPSPESAQDLLRGWHRRNASRAVSNGLASPEQLENAPGPLPQEVSRRLLL
jgi:nicotinamidase-related amidase